MDENNFQPLLIGGQRVLTDEHIAVVNPYTQECIGYVGSATLMQMEDAIHIAAAYVPSLTRYQRSRILGKVAELVKKCADQLAYQVIAESGLCWKDAMNEVCRTQDVFSIAAALSIQEDGEVFAGDISAHGKNRKIISFREPVTAIGAITPFNHPLCQIAHKVAPAVATNNCVVLKPSEKTPFSAYRIAEILYEAGLPREMLSVISGQAMMLVDKLVTSEQIEVLAFTGSTSIGRCLAQKAPYKRLLLELGGNDALVVLPDADIDEAVDLALRGAFGNSGQRCTAIKRILVSDELADLFADKLAAEAAKLKCGNPFQIETDVGPVISEEAACAIEQRVTDAIKEGAKLLVGHKRQGALYTPTVLDHVAATSSLVVHETFGPVAPIIRFKTIEEAILIINGTEFGLSAGLCTNNWPWIMRFVQQLKVGSINVREIPGYRTEMSPFGGIKGSGLGSKEGLFEAMRFYTNVKTLSVPWF